MTEVPRNFPAKKAYKCVEAKLDEMNNSGRRGCLSMAAVLAGALNFFNIKSYGAVGNGKVLDTNAINQAVEACSQAGGGVVYFPAGEYLSGSIELKSNVTLYLDSGATILGSKRYGKNLLLLDFDPHENMPFKLYQDPSHSYFHRSLIWGEKVHNIAILGRGTIDLNGTWEIPAEIQEQIVKLMSKGLAYDEIAEKLGISDEILHYLLTYGLRGPKTIALKESQNILIRDITIKNGTDIGILLAGCDDVNINGVTIETYIDGINLDGCHNATISGCRIKSGDDAIALKSSYALNRIRSCEDITISNCTVRSQCLGIKMGTESNGGFKNISITNCVIYDTLLGGVALEIVDGGTLEDVIISDIVMENVEAPIFIRLGNRAQGPDNPPVGKIRDVSISNVMAIVDKPPCFILNWVICLNKLGFLTITMLSRRWFPPSPEYLVIPLRISH